MAALQRVAMIPFVRSVANKDDVKLAWYKMKQNETKWNPYFESTADSVKLTKTSVSLAALLGRGT